MTMRPTNLLNFDSPAFGGPFGLTAPLFDEVAAPEFEGLWTPLFGIKQASLEISGKMDTLSCQLYGTNVLNPLNGYIVTIAGSVLAGDIPQIVFNSPNIAPVTINYTAVSGDTATSVAAALVALINANASLASLGLRATSALGVITMNWPSAFTNTSNEQESEAAPVIANSLVLVATVGGTASETIAVTLPATGVALGSAITSLGLTSIGSVIPRYIKARIATLTGSGAVVNGNLQGAA